MLAEEHRRTLLTIARESIVRTLAGHFVELNPSDYHEDLHKLAGAFVTLKTNDGDLRGCIGSIRAIEPMFRAVSTSAIAAAIRDPRFPPVRSEEMAWLELEVSVMGPIERVTEVSEIVVGRDGLIVSRGRYAGLLLPQVATEYGWDLHAFLEQTCMKAGLPPSAWRSSDTRIERFSAEVFGERNHSPVTA